MKIVKLDPGKIKVHVGLRNEELNSAAPSNRIRPRITIAGLEASRPSCTEENKSQPR